MPLCPRSYRVGRRAPAFLWCALLLGAQAHAVTLAAKEKAEGCSGRATIVQGTNLYKCQTQSGMHYFNLEAPAGDGRGARGSSATPQGFPKVDATTQKNRDTVRRKVLTDELAVEEKLLAEAKAAYGNGAPPPTAEEKDAPQKYTERLARLRQTVALHEKNIEALKKELATTQ